MNTCLYVLFPAGFSKLQSKDVIPVVVVSLVPPVLVAIVAVTAFYFYRTHRPDKPGPPARPGWPTARTPELYQAFDLPSGGLGARGERGGGGGVIGPGAEGEGSNSNNDIVGDITDWHGQLAEPLPIKLDVLVGKGRFAEVWRARLLQGERGGANAYETVAVKVFPAVEYASWRNECSIVSDPKLEHDNVVRFLAAEERGPPGHALREYWLVLAYHGLGNLQDFLTANILSWQELVPMAGSIAKGIAHLHSDTTPSGVPKVGLSVISGGDQNPFSTSYLPRAPFVPTTPNYCSMSVDVGATWTFIVLSSKAEVHKDTTDIILVIC